MIKKFKIFEHINVLDPYNEEDWEGKEIYVGCKVKLNNKVDDYVYGEKRPGVPKLSDRVLNFKNKVLGVSDVIHQEHSSVVWVIVAPSYSDTRFAIPIDCLDKI